VSLLAQVTRRIKSPTRRLLITDGVPYAVAQSCNRNPADHERTAALSAAWKAVLRDRGEIFSMRKFVKMTVALLAAASMVLSLSGSAVAAAAAGVPATPTTTPSNPNGGSSHPWPYVLCGVGSAAAEMIGAAAHANDKKDPRQSTIFEAGWYAAVCPLMLPVALVVTATCRDNKATYEIARQARRYGLKHQPADWTPFTNAYGEACRTGKLSPAFRTFLKANGLKLSAAYLRH
jgi:hypothetical protein